MANVFEVIPSIRLISSQKAVCCKIGFYPAFFEFPFSLNFHAP
jgi:hypothetical protein